MYNNNNSGNHFNKGNDRPRSKIVRLFLCDCSCDRNNNRYNLDELTKILEEIKDSFKLISIPVFMTRADFNGEADAKGNTRIGFVRSYDPVNMAFDVSITGHNVEKVEPMLSKLQILPSVLVRNGKLVCITSLDVCKDDDYMKLYEEAE